MMRSLLSFACLLAAFAAPVHAQSSEAEPSPLAAYVGLWEVEVGETPIGVLTGVLVVREDGTGTLSLVEMAVENAPVTGLRVLDEALVGAVPEMYSAVAGRYFICALRLTRTDSGTLDGVLDVDDGRAYPMTARRPADSP